MVAPIDKKVENFKLGEKVRVGALLVEIKGFEHFQGQVFIETVYGNFNLSVVEKLNG